MTATFLIEVEVLDPSPATLLAEAEAILDACEGGGIAVNSVKPWAREALAPAPGLPPITLPGT